eukprot:contig_17838_g4372
MPTNDNSDLVCLFCPRVFHHVGLLARHVKATHRIRVRYAGRSSTGHGGGGVAARLRALVPGNDDQPPPFAGGGEDGEPTPLADDNGNGGDDDPPPLMDDNGTGWDDEPPPLMDDPCISGPPLPLVDDSNDEEAEERVVRQDGMERGSLLAGAAASPRQAVWCASISSKIKAFYERFGDAKHAVPCVNPATANVPTLFNTPETASVLRFTVTAGGVGLSHVDQVQYAQTLFNLEAAMAVSTGVVGQMTQRFRTPYSMVTAVRAEHDRVLAEREWRQVDIFECGQSNMLFYRSALKTGVQALQTADSVVLEGAPMQPAADGQRRRSGLLNSDMFLKEQAEVRRLHGPNAYVLGFYLHSDEAVVSSNGSQLMYPVRIWVVNVLDGGGRWITVGHLPRIPKVVGNGKNSRSRRAVSDGRHNLVQRCYALILRELVDASEHGISVDVPSHGSVLLVPRILGLVTDQLEERGLLGLMGCASTFNCSHCLARRELSCTDVASEAPPRDVVSTLEAQLHAAEARQSSGRPRTRVALGRAISALPFVPAMGMVHGLGTGNTSLYRIVSFDTLHVWKLGVLRLLTQRLPNMLAAVCPKGWAVMGSVQDTLDAVNLRGFELGRLCRASPTSPARVLCEHV